MTRVVLSVVGTRPNFMKIAPVARALKAHPAGFRHILVHTGQHYDPDMSDVFLRELQIGAPDFFLDVRGGSHAQQTARVLERLESVLAEVGPQVMLVPGDVNSSLGAALAAAKAGIPIGHVEAGLRSFDRTMPEEINRVLIDQVSAFLFTHSPEARLNLLREGCPAEAIHEVGNTMIDTLAAMRTAIEAVGLPQSLGLAPRSYVVVTLHRPALVDGPLLAETVRQIDALSEHLPVVFPVHPRTRGAMKAAGVEFASPAVRLLPPLGYLEFVSLLADAAAALTDSGGIQEETTYLGVPCFTLRSTTERPVTVEAGTNTLLGLEPHRITEVPVLLAVAVARRSAPRGWDGHAAERIVDVLVDRLGQPEAL